MSSMMLDGVFHVFVFLQGEGMLGVGYYAAFLALWTMCCLPTTPLEIAAGFTFSTVHSVVASIIGKTAGSVITFTLARFFASRFLSAVSASATRGGTLGRIRELAWHLESAVVARPVQTLTMVRASPMPIALKNYGLALLPAHVVQLPTFALITLVVNVPYSIAWSLTGSSASSLQEALNGKPGNDRGLLASKVGMLVALFTGLALFARKATAELASAERAADDAAAANERQTPVAQPDFANKVKAS